jgi:arginase family enzyme
MGTPEIGGLTTIEAQRLIRGLRGINLVGADVVEVSPPFNYKIHTDSNNIMLLQFPLFF